MFEDRTTEKLKEETLAAIAPEAGISTMAGSYADGMVEAVKDSIRARRPVGASVSVEAAGELEVSVIAAVTLSGTSVPQVQEELERRLRDYFRELVRQKFGTIYYGPEADLPYTLYYNRVLALLLTIEGVQTFSTLTINDGTADVSIPAGSVPKLKEVHVT